MSGQETGGSGWPSVSKSDLPSLFPALAGIQCGRLRITTGLMILQGGYPHLEVCCLDCGKTMFRQYYRLRQGDSNCRACYCRVTNPNRLKSVPESMPFLAGRVFCERLEVTTGEVIRVGKQKRCGLEVRCLGCGAIYVRSYSDLTGGRAGCKSCASSSGVPNWLLMRCRSAKKRCENPRDEFYPDYGGRGIQFRFASPAAMGQWIMENLGLNRELTIDREENNGHYEPGNIRLVTWEEQANNRRARKTGYRRRSRKCSTSSTPDPAIASRPTD